MLEDQSPIGPPVRRCDKCGRYVPAAEAIERVGAAFCSDACVEHYFCTPEDTEIASLAARVSELEAAVLAIAEYADLSPEEEASGMFLSLGRVRHLARAALSPAPREESPDA